MREGEEEGARRRWAVDSFIVGVGGARINWLPSFVGLGLGEMAAQEAARVFAAQKGCVCQACPARAGVVSQSGAALKGGYDGRAF